jgi:hypothetical protein
VNPLDIFKARLASHLKIDLELVINENRSTMLNLLEKKEGSARLSVHKMFLQAPESVLSAIAHYVRGERKGSRVLRQYIQEHLSQYDYRHLVNRQQLVTQGRFYQLKPLYDVLNEKYFGSKLDLSITWYGIQKKRKTPKRVTFGQYLSGLRLIKIHRRLDDPFFPEYFVTYVVYHEMLHSVIPGGLDNGGRYCFHSPAFKEKEKLYEHYQRAIEWEKKYQRIWQNGWT